MNKLPPIVIDHLLEIVSSAGNIAYLNISHGDRLIDSGGALTAFGLNHIRPERHASEQILFLKGLIPLPQPKFLLPFVETPSGIPADIHLFREGDNCWVILLDVSQKHARQRRVQQTGNELSLSLEKKMSPSWAEAKTFPKWSPWFRFFAHIHKHIFLVLEHHGLVCS